MSNLQALELDKINCLNKILITDNISFEYKNLVNLDINSWIKIDINYLNALLIENNSYTKCKIEAIGSYIYIELSKSISKFKNKIKKDTIRFKIDLGNKIVFNKSIISKQPISAILEIKSRYFANVDIYFDDSIYINIKEIL